MEKVIDIRPIKKQMRSSCKEARRSMDKALKANYDKKIQNKIRKLPPMHCCASEADFILSMRQAIVFLLGDRGAFRPPVYRNIWMLS